MSEDTDIFKRLANAVNSPNKTVVVLQRDLAKLLYYFDQLATIIDTDCVQMEEIKQAQKVLDDNITVYNDYLAAYFVLRKLASTKKPKP